MERLGTRVYGSPHRSLPYLPEYLDHLAHLRRREHRLRTQLADVGERRLAQPSCLHEGVLRQVLDDQFDKLDLARGGSSADDQITEVWMPTPI